MFSALRAIVISVLLATTVDAAEPADPKAWHRLVGILQYLEADYPAAVTSHSQFELKEQHAFLEEAISTTVELGPQGSTFAQRLKALEPAIARGQDGEGVSRACGELVREAVRVAKLDRRPLRPPHLELGAELYQVACAPCHAADGSGRVAIAPTMNPKPTNFLDPEVMDGLTPYKAYNTTTFGVPGTPMPAYPSLSDDERWSIAFFLFTFRQPSCPAPGPRLSLEQLSNATDPELVEAYGAKALPCIRKLSMQQGPQDSKALQVPQTPQASNETGGLPRAEAGVRQALELAAAGNRAEARRALIDAYLEGLEPEEPRLRGRDPVLTQSLEEQFLSLRQGVESGDAHVPERGTALLALLQRARDGEAATQQFASIFGLTALILLREGFEAMVVIAALLAVLKKMGEERSARIVHGGWISAIVAGGLVYVLGRKAIAGANRELVEGWVGLAAAAMLVYAAIWLNARANIRRFMGELRQKMQGALGRESQLGLFAIAFASMFRESLETALFIEGLALDSPSGAAWGALAGAAVLALLFLLIRRIGYRLPMKTLFSASTVLLVATAVVMLGKGLHALQEVGWLPLRPIPMFPRVELLGIFPDAVSLLPQLILTMLSLSRNLSAFSRSKP